MKNIRRIICGLLVLVLSVQVLSFSASAKEDASMPEVIESGFIDSDGVKLEYAVYGKSDGYPLLLLHPNGGSMHSFDDNVLSDMAKYYKVITYSTRASGNSQRGNDRLTFDLFSNDIVNILDYLNIEKTNIFGFSDGGNLGIVFTVQHQDRVNKLAVMGANINTRGTKTVVQIGIDLTYLFYTLKACLTGKEEDAIKRDIQGMMVGQPKLTFCDLHEIKVPVLNMYGEFDLFKRTHSRMITKSIDGAKEIMIMGCGHSTCYNKTDEIIIPALLELFGTD